MAKFQTFTARIGSNLEICFGNQSVKFCILAVLKYRTLLTLLQNIRRKTLVEITK